MRTLLLLLLAIVAATAVVPAAGAGTLVFDQLGLTAHGTATIGGVDWEVGVFAGTSNVTHDDASIAGSVFKYKSIGGIGVGLAQPDGSFGGYVGAETFTDRGDAIITLDQSLQHGKLAYSGNASLFNPLLDWWPWSSTTVPYSVNLEFDATDRAEVHLAGAYRLGSPDCYTPDLTCVFASRATNAAVTGTIVVGGVEFAIRDTVADDVWVTHSLVSTGL